MEYRDKDVEQMVEDLRQHTSLNEPTDNDRIAAKTICKTNNAAGLEVLTTWLQSDKFSFKLLAVKNLIYSTSIVGHQEVIKLVQNILISKEERALHAYAASLLGQISSWPEPALIVAMTESENSVVRGEAFRSALMLAGIPYAIAREKAGSVATGQVKPTEALVNKVAKHYLKSH